MLSSMYSGVSGLLSHQTKMDVIGNNIANVNTTAFKSSSVSFEEVFSQLIKSAQPPSEEGNGGTNPQQIGLGVTIGNINTNMASGSIQRTDNPNDLAIDGEGFFMVSDGISQYYTRAGNFNIDRDGSFVSSSGARVLGWNQNAQGVIDSSTPVEVLNFANLKMEAKATDKITFTGNINSQTAEYNSTTEENAILYNITVYDSLGDNHTITFKFMKTANDNEYDYSIIEDDDNMTVSAGATGGTITFDAMGKISTTTVPVTPAITIEFTSGADDLVIEADNIIFDAKNFTQYANSTDISGVQNGFTSGELENLSIDRDGKVIGQFTNGLQQHVATLAISSFINPNGLEKIGANMFSATWNSGDPSVGTANTGERGSIAIGSLEMSNVDLAKEFTEMIVAQRGFQANSRIITVSDELLQELVNLKR
ncbi:MAG: flagellar hook protein FlgE [Clostridia bacterium]|nr:flagellar hook protein FlgE [Clostridia bacterium]